ncbi:MAG TPA: LysR family transcriptional regulator [Candidatus Limnocylindrales bacterium]|nr:LysR family transcriptional regulator [Candidatus Limnocylindrales bacterium]
MTPELRLIRYFVAVAQEGNVTRAAERLHIAQPSLSAAIKQLEQQLGVELLARNGRQITITPAGELLRDRGRELLEFAEIVVDAVTARDRAGAGRLRLGLSPTARYGIAPQLLAACTASAPAVMIYTTEDATGALLRDVARGQLDMAITFCAPPTAAGVEQMLVREEPAVVHLPAGHPLASRPQLMLPELAEETILVAGSRDSVGFTDRILSAFTELGIAPRTRADPYPDLGLQAVREGLGLVIYARSAFPERLAGSTFVRLDPPLSLPFQLVVREGPKSAAVEAVVSIARGLGETVST